MPDQREIVVVGGGQAGLAIGYFLAQQRRRFTILDAANAPAAAWRDRWDSLRLFTPVRYDSLPGREFPGAPDHYPRRDEVVDYLTGYARHFELPVELGSRVRAVRRHQGGYVVDLGDKSYEAEQVVVATGAFQAGRVPGVAAGLDGDVVSMHSSGYRSPDELPPGAVLVVGGGNTGFQITTEIGSSPRAARRQGIRLHGRALGASGRTVTFDDGTTVYVDAVIWATGFATDHSWIAAPVFDRAGAVLHERGVTSSPGLYFLGLPWLHTRGSALLGWVQHDARHIANQIAAYAPTERRG